jgi:hypothetical protein
VRIESCGERWSDGLSEVLNLGLEIARAELIAVVNVSDVLEPRKLERQVASFDGGHEVDVVFHRRPEIPFFGPELLRGQRLRSAFFERNLVPPGTAMFRRAVLRATGLFEPSPDPEYQLWLKAAVSGFSFECIEENLVRSSNVEPRPLPPSESVSQMLASMRARYTTEDRYPNTELPARPYVPGEPSHVACFTSSTEEKTVEAVLEGYLRSAPPEQGNAFLWLTDSAQATRRFVELYEGTCERIGLAPQTGPPIDVYQVRPQELHSVFRAQLLWAQDVFSSTDLAASGPASADKRLCMEQGKYLPPRLNPIQRERLARRSVPFQSDFLDVRLPELPRLPGMITTQEQQYLYWLTSEGFTGSGVVVEVGTWLGRSTIHLGAGLLANGYSSHLHCFDKYVWIKAYEAPRLNPGFTLEEGADFKPYFERNVCPVYPNVRVTKTAIDELTWDEGPIEILFLDAPKSFRDITTALVKFGPYLIPDLSIIVFQDYLHAPSYPIASVVSVLPQLQLLHVVPNSSTAAFAVRGPMAYEKPPLEWYYTRWSTEEIFSNWKKILDPLSPQPRSFIEPGLCLLLFDLGRKEEAIRYLRRITFTPEGRERWQFLGSVASNARYKELFQTGS